MNMRVGGADGCRAGWILVEREGTGELRARVCNSVSALRDSSRDFAVLAVDIPIGLMDDGPRECDVLARRLLTQRGSSVFPAPVRSVLEAVSYADACERSMAACGKRLSRQTWALVARIKDMDTAVRTDTAFRSIVYEIHPELSFYFWNLSVPLSSSKRTGLGFVERLKLSENHYGSAFTRLRGEVSTRDVADDDLLDAIAALWTAERIAQGSASRVPDHDAFDTFGIPMQMLA